MTVKYRYSTVVDRPSKQRGKDLLLTRKLLLPPQVAREEKEVLELFPTLCKETILYNLA